MDQALEKALARIAALEAKLASQAQPTPSAAPQMTGIDPRELIANPVGVLTRHQVPLDHVSRVLVAHHLGDNAPPELRMLAQQGPLVSATQALASDLQGVRQRLDAYEERDRKEARRSSFSALAADKTKYPLLAAAIAKDPTLFMGEAEAFQGDAAALAESIEGRIKTLQPIFGTPQPASNEHAETQAAQSQQSKQAQPGAVDPTPPAIPQPKPGVFTPETHEEVKARILRKYPQAGVQQ